MAYSVPDTWIHGDIPTATKMNKYSNGLNEIYSLYAGKLLIPSVAVLWNLHGNIPTNSAARYELVHKFRWLLYVGEGNIYNADESESSALPNSAGGTGTNTFDLDSVSWLTYGMRYLVRSVTVCMEVDNA